MQEWKDFEVIGQLGSRNHRKFNEVKRVRNRLTGELGVLKHAVKTTQNQHLIPLMRQEAKLNFESPFLPRTLAFEETETEIWMIRNFQEGVSLQEYWHQIPKKERVDFIFRWIEKLIPLFDELKSKQIVHADLKPSNFILEKKGTDFDVKLIDFGISIDQQLPIERNTLFALGFSAPELILNKIKLVNNTTDLFSLGITIWFLFTGKLPLSHPNPGIMTNLQITHPLPMNRLIPREFHAVLSKMCFKHSFHLPPNLLPESEVDTHLIQAMNQRFQDLREVLEALKIEKEKSKSGFFSRLFK